jgi:uncharacterized cupin superfamily protein
VTLAHWDETEHWTVPARLDPLGGRWTDLGDAAGSVGVGVKRLQVPEGKLSTPVHVHSREEEIFFVLAGSGLLWQDGKTCVLRPGDTIVAGPGGKTHTLIGGPDELDVLAFGPRLAPEAGHLPRAGISWLAHHAVRIEDRHPWELEAEHGLPDGEPAERPPNVVNVDEVEGDYGGLWKRVGREAGALRTGLNWATLPPHEEGAPPHCHSAEEELFVVLDGEGTLELWAPPSPDQPRPTEPRETQAVRRGHVIARPPGTRVSHCLRTGDHPMTYLAYGTREPNDICWYPRSNKVFLRGVGVIARLELLDYDDGEPS